MDDWKQKADAKTTAVTKNDVQPKAPGKLGLLSSLIFLEPKEKQTVIDPKAYFAMFSSAQKPKKTSTPEAVPVPQPQVEKDAIEIEQEEEPTHKVDPPLHQGDDDNPEEIQKNNVIIYETLNVSTILGEGNDFHQSKRDHRNNTRSCYNSRNSKLCSNNPRGFY